MAAAGYAVAGSCGLLVVTAALGVLALVTAWLAITVTTAPGTRSDQVGRVNAAFSSYWRIESALTAGRRLDQEARPMLWRLLTALLADRRRVDPVKDPDAARQAIGADVWPLLAQPREPGAPGITTAALTTIADRLEEL